MIKSFSGQVVFCFALCRAISAYVGENRLSQYTGFPKNKHVFVDCTAFKIEFALYLLCWKLVLTCTKPF